MRYSDVILKSERGILFSLSNEFPDEFQLTDAIEDAKDANDLLNRLRKIDSYIKEFSLSRETDAYIRYKLIANMCNNEYYLIIYK